MSETWIRVPPERGDTVAAGVVAGAVAAGVGLVTFYLVRTLLAREPLSGGAPPPARVARGGRDGEGA
jgi:hypothetical protein